MIVLQSYIFLDKSHVSDRMAIENFCLYKTIDKSEKRDIKLRTFHCKIEKEGIVLFKDIIIIKKKYQKKTCHHFSPPTRRSS